MAPAPALPPALLGARGLVVAVLLLGSLLLTLHGSVIRWPFLSDDFIFLSHSRSVGQLFSAFDQFPNYFRPIGRELYFFAGHALFGNRPLPFHLLNFTLLLGIVALVVALGARLGGLRAGLLSGAVYASLYSHRVLLAWVSCSQDLLATLFVLLAAHALLSAHPVRAGLWHLAALLSKESVAALPLVHAMWRVLEAPAGTPWRQRARAAAREGASLWAATAAWAAMVLAVRLLRRAWAASQTTPVADVTLSAGQLWEGMRSAVLSYVALEQPTGVLLRTLVDPKQPWLPLVVSAAVVVLVALLAGRLPGPARGERGRPDSMLTLGATWALVGALPVALAGHHFSAYYVTFSGAGCAWFAGRLLAGARPVVAAAVLVIGVTLGLAANRTDLFNLTRHDPVAGASFITISRLHHERVFLDSLQVALERVRPARGAAVYISYGPKYMTFATADNRAPRIWLDDPSFDLQLIGHYPGAGQSRPHAFLRFDGDTRGFVHVPNDVMDADLASESAMSARRPDVARAHIERALAALPADGPLILRVDLLNNLGLASSAMGDTARARAAFREALLLDAGARSPALNLARLDAEAGRLEDSRRQLRSLLAATPDATDAWSLLVRVEAARGDLESARAAWQRLNALDPNLAATLQGVMGAPAPPGR